MENKINEATELLKENGYTVKKITAAMKKDSDECEKYSEDKECIDCACSVCIMQ